MSGWLDAVSSALCGELFSFFKAHWHDAKDFVNSVFFTAIAGSLAGAFAGARAAQHIAEKTRTGVIDFHPDFRTLPVLKLPLSVLQAQIFEKLSIHGGPIALITTLIQSVDGLNMAIMKRNQLVELYKASSLPPKQLLALYFGFPFNGGQVNQEYPDSMEAIFTQTDDGIFFSTKLCDDLSEHGDQLSASFKKRFRKGSPQIIKPDLSKARDDDLMPSDGNYADWVNMFVSRADRPSHVPHLGKMYPKMAE